MLLSRRSLSAGFALFSFVFPIQFAAAQDAPVGGNVTIVVPFPAGGTVDAVARQVQPGLQERLKATVIIENKPGAAGSTGATQVARSAPDGRTWLFVFDTQAVNPFLLKLPFDTEKDLAPVMLIGTAPNVLATNPSKPFKTLADVVAAAKQKPGALTYATIGAGSLGHLTMVRLSKQLGIQLNHVPYRGGGPALNDALAGHVDLIIASAALLNPQFSGNTLRPIAQFGEKRAASPELANVPTAAESGAAGVESYAWWGVFAPAATPVPVIERFARDLRATLQDPKVAEKLTQSQQISIRAAGPAELKTFFANEMKVWGAIVRENNIEIGSQ
ncbi:MAG: Bug family tripartite tricarboxylate transporter substrate binding protein [Pseudomonadota bacterium]|jgi:tripartite-type tricarboxylate transporter receptor subunit TctC